MPYQTLTRSLESVTQAPVTAHGFFWCAVGHVLYGLVDIDRHHRAGRQFESKRLSESTLVRIVEDELRIYMNPFSQCMLRTRNLLGALRLHQSLNAYLSVKKEVGFGGDGVLALVSCTKLPLGKDLAVCRDAYLMGWTSSLPASTKLKRALSAVRHWVESFRCVLPISSAPWRKCLA